MMRVPILVPPPDVATGLSERALKLVMMETLSTRMRVEITASLLPAGMEPYKPVWNNVTMAPITVISPEMPVEQTAYLPDVVTEWWTMARLVMTAIEPMVMDALTIARTKSRVKSAATTS